MTDKQPEALAYAGALEASQPNVYVGVVPTATQLLRNQHAALERKDALLSKCLKHVASNISMTSDGTDAEDLYDAIQAELAK